MKKQLRIATRQSKLALWQANFVRQRLQQHYPDLVIELVGLTTQGDVIQDKSLADIGGKGLFIKVLEEALLNNTADIAVHSLKDVPPQLANSLTIAAVLKREDARDVFVSNTYQSIDALPSGAIVGTCSVRRQAQLLAYRADLRVKSLRGNVDTRLKKLDAGEFDAIIQAAAGLKRIGCERRISQYLPIAWMLPSVAQGAIGIECRSNDTQIIDGLQPLQDTNTRICTDTERALVRALKGNCHSPIGAYALIENDRLTLHGVVASADGKRVLRVQQTVSLAEQEALGVNAAEALLAQGARDILSSSS